MMHELINLEHHRSKAHQTQHMLNTPRVTSLYLPIQTVLRYARIDIWWFENLWYTNNPTHHSNQRRVRAILVEAEDNTSVAWIPHKERAHQDVGFIDHIKSLSFHLFLYTRSPGKSSCMFILRTWTTPRTKTNTSCRLWTTFCKQYLGHICFPFSMVF